MKTYRPAEKSELREVATLFTESFLDYPLFPLMLSQSADYRQRLFRLNAVNVKSYAQQGGCFVGTLDGKIVSAVLLREKDAAAPGLLRYLGNGGAALAVRVGVRRILGILRTLDVMKEACNRSGNAGWYIDSFAVAKGYQGRRLGSSLFHDFIFPHVARQGGGRITLVTHTELNKKFYMQNGFEVFDERLIGPGERRLTNYSFETTV